MTVKKSVIENISCFMLKFFPYVPYNYVATSENGDLYIKLKCYMCNLLIYFTFRYIF